MDQYIGKWLDERYEILEKIGEGGMSVVYKARCHRLNRLVAVKILKSDLARDAELRRRFYDESRAVAMLSHPNIVSVYDVSHTDEADYIVMELIDGITLKQYMRRRGEPLKWREALHFITQIVKGLSHAHSRGIIHRDIKPQNIMVLRDGSVKVADFGIARLTSATQSTLTQEALGSVHYISPEQAKGSHIDGRSDLYSAGVVLYEMLSGRLPYEGDTPISVAIQHINSIPLSPREINPNIPEALEAITMRAMASDVNKRYASADDMLADLEEFRKNPSIRFDYTEEDLALSSDEPTRAIPAAELHAVAASAQQGRESVQPYPEDGEGEVGSVEDDYDNASRRTSASRAPAITAVAAILLFLLGVGIFLWKTLSSSLNPPSDTYIVPRLVGQQYAEVADDTELLGPFTVVLGQSVIGDAPAGQIIKQTPDSGRTVKSGSLTITVDVSLGRDVIVIDNYQNRRARDIELLLQGKGLVVTIVEESNEKVTQDFIISQSIPSGTSMSPGDEIILTVSSGPEVELTTLIPLTGMPLDYAREKIDDLKLKLDGLREVYSEDQPVGYVVWQSIDPNTEVPEGTMISLQISKGPEPLDPSDDPEETETPSQSPQPSESPSQSPEPTTSPSVSPSPEPPASESPEPSQEPSPSPVVRVQKTITIQLPPERTENTQVRVTVGGEKQYDSSIDPSVSVIYPSLSASGTQEIQIFFDGVLVESRTESFSE